MASRTSRKVPKWSKVLLLWLLYLAYRSNRHFSSSSLNRSAASKSGPLEGMQSPQYRPQHAVCSLSLVMEYPPADHFRTLTPRTVGADAPAGVADIEGIAFLGPALGMASAEALSHPRTVQRVSRTRRHADLAVFAVEVIVRHIVTVRCNVQQDRPQAKSIAVLAVREQPIFRDHAQTGQPARGPSRTRRAGCPRTFVPRRHRRGRTLSCP